MSDELDPQHSLARVQQTHNETQRRHAGGLEGWLHGH